MADKRPPYKTPIGTAGWVALDEPDTKYCDKTDPNDKGTFKVMLRLPKEDPKTCEFIDYLNGIMDRFIAEEGVRQGKKVKTGEHSYPYIEELDDDDKPTGSVLVRCKLKARLVINKPDGTQKIVDQRPKVFDSAGNLLNPVPRVGPGSQLICAGKVHTWYVSKCGMTLWLEGVSVRDLIEFGGGPRNAEDYGFEKEEGGYVAPPVEEAVENVQDDGEEPESTKGDY